LTDDQWKALRDVSAATGKSVSELVRRGVDRYLAERNEATPEERIERAIRVAGRFSSGFQDVSDRHDQHLADAFRR
jgi:hypothetical protein